MGSRTPWTLRNSNSLKFEKNASWNLNIKMSVSAYYFFSWIYIVLHSLKKVFDFYLVFSCYVLLFKMALKL